MLIVKAQIKDTVRATATGIDNVSADFAEKLNEKVLLLVKDACYRAQQNGRKTVMGKDI
ncbi:MAG TPA: DUF1931 domain-containing protein [Candidatus Nanoarchaeia archaeon]|nr:DUF1931 domain-containing protein [Candidatus Nanoarchaeia archaeon]